MHQETWVHRHLQACNFVFDPGWRRLHRQWCIHQLFAGRFQDDGAYHKWRVHLWRRRAVRVRRRRRRAQFARNIVISLQYRTKRAGSLREAAVYGGPGNARSKKRRLDPRQDPAVVESVSAARFDAAIEVRVKNNK